MKHCKQNAFWPRLLKQPICNRAKFDRFHRNAFTSVAGQLFFCVMAGDPKLWWRKSTQSIHLPLVLLSCSWSTMISLQVWWSLQSYRGKSTLLSFLLACSSSFFFLPSFLLTGGPSRSTLHSIDGANSKRGSIRLNHFLILVRAAVAQLI